MHYTKTDSWPDLASRLWFTKAWHRWKITEGVVFKCGCMLESPAEFLKLLSTSGSHLQRFWVIGLGGHSSCLCILVPYGKSVRAPSSRVRLSELWQSSWPLKSLVFSSYSLLLFVLISYHIFSFHFINFPDSTLVLFW